MSPDERRVPRLSATRHGQPPLRLLKVMARSLTPGFSRWPLMLRPSLLSSQRPTTAQGAAPTDTPSIQLSPPLLPSVVAPWKRHPRAAPLAREGPLPSLST
eukprot:6426200-Alexandrium_andersonii.AAC.1